LRIGLVQLIYAAIGLGLALLVAEIDVGADVDSDRVASLFFSLTGGLVALIALVFSLLFLVVPYANTSLTPRLTLFRDNPIVWHSFAYFVGVFVFLSVGGLVVTNDSEVSFLVPLIALVVVLGSLGMVRSLQFGAYRSLQLGATLSDITAAGRRVIDVLYPDQFTDAAAEQAALPPVVSEVRWSGDLCFLRQIDLPKLVRQASAADAVVELPVGVGEELRPDVVIFAIRGASGGVQDGELVRLVDTGPDRSFEQDPLFAFRLLVDIALRALSSAINDPLTAVQAIGGVHELLHLLVHRDLDVGRVGDEDGTLRVVLTVPSWDDYLAIGVDEMVSYIAAFPQSRRRLVEMVESLLEEAPPSRRASLASRQRALAALRPEVG
jgi:uncharacterized membrane protein